MIELNDGIIQEVFERLGKELAEKEMYFALSEVQQTKYELIEKIKQEIPKLKEIRCSGWECGCENGEYIDEESLLEKLIGDNQE